MLKKLDLLRNKISKRNEEILREKLIKRGGLSVGTDKPTSFSDFRAKISNLGANSYFATGLLDKNEGVSVIIPCYNDGKYLMEAVESVEKCDRGIYEIIIVDDGSSDKETLNVLDSMAWRGHKVIRIKHSDLAAARNVGAEKAEYSYLLFLDADNKIEKEYITESIKIFNQNPKVGVVYGDRHEFGLWDKNIIQQDFDISKEIFFNTIDVCAVVRKKTFENCGGFDENLYIWEDWEFFLNAFEKGWDLIRIPKVMFYYRIRKNSISSRNKIRKNRVEGLKYIYRKHYQIFIKNFEDNIYGGSSPSLLDKDTQIENLKNRLYDIENSLSFKILRKCQIFVDSIFRKGFFFRKIRGKFNIFQDGTR